MNNSYADTIIVSSLPQMTGSLLFHRTDVSLRGERMVISVAALIEYTRIYGPQTT